mmetsp:Transcript_5659/g.8452  ORF Transcript_5659/g.8452 Transcript_5659/m.8452 type:complete len:81 (-) Transcript_5659:653-895(-)
MEYQKVNPSRAKGSKHFMPILPCKCFPPKCVLPSRRNCGIKTTNIAGISKFEDIWIALYFRRFHCIVRFRDQYPGIILRR